MHFLVEWIRRAFMAMDTRRGAAVVLALLVAAHVALNLVWLRLDNHVIRIDEEFHAMGAQNYYFALTDPAQSGLAARWNAVASIQSPYPPLLHLLGAAMALPLGYSPDVVALSGTLCFALLLLGVYRLARAVLPRPPALLATVVCSLIPVLYAGARYVALENLIAALVVWALFCLLRSRGFVRVSAVAAFGVLNGLVILTKPNGFVYYLLPAACIFFAALVRCLRAGGLRAVWPVSRNGLLCIALTLAVAAPWYVANWGLVSNYWMNEHKGGRTPFAFAQVKGAPRPSASSTPITELANTKPADRAASPAPNRTWDFGVLNTLRTREWGAYGLYTITNGAFLPLTVIGMAGLLLGAWRYRRNRAFWLLVAWLVGAYVLNTLLFRFINARYAMPFIPMLAVGAAMLVTSLPGPWLRRGMATLLLLLLSLQYLNISFVGDARWNTWVPWFKDHYRVARSRDLGLPITKGEVITGTYCFRAPVTGENYVERSFRVMRDSAPAPVDSVGTPRAQAYVLLESENNFGGFGFLRRTYAPDPNPLLRAELVGRPELQRGFSHAGRYLQPKEAIEASDTADNIVVVMTQTDETLAWGPNHPYCFQVLQESPFDLVDFFYTPRFGLLPGAMVAVLERRPTTATPGDLFTLRDAPDLRHLSLEQAAALRTENGALLPEGTAPRALNPQISFLGTAMRRVSEYLLQVRAVYRCDAPEPRALQFVFEFAGMSNGTVAYPMDAHTPVPQWTPGQIYTVDCFLQMPPGKVSPRLHLLDERQQPAGQSIELGSLNQ